MNTYNKTARIVGLLFLIAMVASLLSIGLLESILNAPDYLVNLYPNKTKVVISTLLEIINAAAVIGIAVMMFPIFKKLKGGLGLGYVGFRVIESVASTASAVGLLSLLTLSQEYLKAGTPDASYFQTLGTLFMAARANWALVLGIFFSFAALIFYYLMYQSKLIPRFISVWGLIAVALVLVWNLLDIFGVNMSMIFALPIILNEIFLALWLIVKGFNPSAIAPASAKGDKK